MGVGEEKEKEEGVREGEEKEEEKKERVNIVSRNNECYEEN